MTTTAMPMTDRPAATGRRAGRTWRQLLVWLHVASSVSWMSQAAALAVLLFVAAGAGPLTTRVGAVESAHILDSSVLVFSANVSAATGFFLSATTSWGFVHFRWVAAKFVSTLGQLYVGIFVLSGRLNVAADALRAGDDGGLVFLAGAATLMAGAFAAQVWLSVAKPGGRTAVGRSAGKLATAPSWSFACAFVAPLGDVALSLGVLGHPTPILSLLLLVVLLVRRRIIRAGVRASRPAAASRG